MDEEGSVTAGMRGVSRGQRNDEDFQAIHKWVVRVLERKLNGIVSSTLLNTPEDIVGEVHAELLRQSEREGTALKTLLQEGDRWDLTRWVWAVARGVISHDTRTLRADGGGRVYNEANSPEPSQNPIHTTSSGWSEPGDLAAFRELLGRVEAAITGLSDEQKLACKLRSEGASFPEIATHIFEQYGKRFLPDTVGNWFRRGELGVILNRALGVAESHGNG